HIVSSPNVIFFPYTTLFRSENIDRLKEIILKEIEDHPEISEGILPDQLEESFNQIEELKWSINSENFSVYWDEYEVAIGAVGAIELEIPLDQMAPLLTPKAREYLDRPDLDEGDDPQITDKQPIEDLDPNGKYVALTF